MANSSKIPNSKKQCQTSLAIATNLEQYRQGLMQTLQQFGDNQDNEEIEDTTLLDDSYVDLEFILYSGPIG